MSSSVLPFFIIEVWSSKTIHQVVLYVCDLLPFKSNETLVLAFLWGWGELQKKNVSFTAEQYFM